MGTGKVGWRGLFQIQGHRQSADADWILGLAADALLGRTFFNGLKWDPQVLADRCECHRLIYIQTL